MSKTMRWGREALLWTGAALGSLCLLALLAGWLFNVTPLVFASGSMSPTYAAGALGLAHEVPASELRVGDVVSVVSDEGNRVTHRIIEIVPTGDNAVLTIQGDANKIPDTAPYTVAVADRVAFGVPYAGYALNAAASPFGLLVVGLFVLGVLWLGFSRRDDDSRAPSPSRARLLVPVGIAGVVLAGASLGASGQTPWAFTSAFWTDTATATTTATTSAPPADTTPPTVTLTYPAAGSNINNGQWSNNGCTLAGKPAGLCGTAADNVGGSGLAGGTAGYELRRTSIAPNTCWNGATFAAAACGNYQAAGGTSASWSIAMAYGTLPTGTYQLRVKVSDVAGNSNRPGVAPAGAPDVSFTK